MGGPGVGRGIGNANTAFAQTFGQILQLKLANDAAAKRQQEDDKRAVFMEGLKNLMQANPGALADANRLGQLLKEGGLKPDQKTLPQLANLFGTLQQGIDGQRAAAAQANAEFNAFAFGGGMPGQPQAPQVAAPASTVPQPAAPPRPADAVLLQPEPVFEQAQGGGPITQFQGTQPTAPAQPTTTGLPPIAPAPAASLAQMHQLARLAPGRNLTLRSPDGKRTVTIDRDEGLAQLAHQLMSQGMRPFDVFRTFQAEVGGAGLPDDVRQAASLDGLSLLLDQDIAKLNQDPNARLDLAGALRTLQQQGLFLNPKDQQDLLEPIAQRVYAGNLRRLETERQRLLAMADLTKDNDAEGAQQLLGQIVANRESEALRLTALQMDGLGLTPEQQRALQNTPTADEVLTDIAISQAGSTSREQLRTIMDLERDKIRLKAEETAATTRARQEAETAVRLEKATVPMNELLTLASRLTSMSNFDLAKNPGLLKEYSDLKDFLKTIVAKGVLGEVGNLNANEATDAIAGLPTIPDLFGSAELSQRKIDRFIRIFSGIGGPNLRLGTAPPQDPRHTTSPEQDRYLDNLGVAP